jgi:hypothetical protein
MPPWRPGAACLFLGEDLIRNRAGKRNIRWNKSSKARGNGISGKDYNDKAALVVDGMLFMIKIN